MTISGYSNAIVDLMLGWLKGIANWVLRLFNLAGSASGSPLVWLADNWSKLLIFFLVLGLVLDRLIWLIRWRPYWVWFRKERVIVNDDRFFINADIDRADDWEGDLASNWDEHDYVVASTVVKRQEAESRGTHRPVMAGARIGEEKRRPGDALKGQRSGGTKTAAKGHRRRDSPGTGTGAAMAAPTSRRRTGRKTSLPRSSRPGTSPTATRTRSSTCPTCPCSTGPTRSPGTIAGPAADGGSIPAYG